MTEEIIILIWFADIYEASGEALHKIYKIAFDFISKNEIKLPDNLPNKEMWDKIRNLSLLFCN